MVKDHSLALQFVLQNTKDKIILTTDFIKHINALVMKHTGNVYNTVLGTVDAGKGEYRKGNVSAGGFYFINYDKLASYTDAFIKKINQNLIVVSTIQQTIRGVFCSSF